MAQFFPSIETIKKYKVQPTTDEAALLNFLYFNLDNSYEVYFNPFLNGDRPDVLIMKRGHGVMIIEVKDWNLKSLCEHSFRNHELPLHSQSKTNSYA